MKDLPLEGILMILDHFKKEPHFISMGYLFTSENNHDFSNDPWRYTKKELEEMLERKLHKQHPFDSSRA